MLTLQKSDKAAWNDLDAYVRYLKDISSRFGDHKSFFNLIISNPFTKKSVDQLISIGWNLTTDLIYEGSINPDNKTIYLREDLEDYRRDSTLFHELVHAWYGECSYDIPIEDQHRRENAAITEWLARKLRAQPDLLKHVIKSFDLQPHVYDRISLEAFVGKDQSTFSFMEESINNYRKNQDVFAFARDDLTGVIM